MFVINVRCHLAFTLLSLLALATCAIFATRSAAFRRLRDAYTFSGFIWTLQSCFIDVLLASCIQLKHVLSATILSHVS